ncbi:molybdenum cofactor biosynthesis protein MoaE [Roseibacterium sp. SDUM158017]|uniref:molybdenum cofactor biosynthesis protein MoaE n=1 Tax=Roseicyclus salinarum TaxID=3036773 RepID=UPI0024153485|nr:molybdenum cofactor biosynthesis protein MoaE [Roseibacterium sp. SDUM158017]MDG4649839.1 molybdenum cofactor biosynthesis protein MoaE [Roseibacterium sp. SDUM158017]
MSAMETVRVQEAAFDMGAELNAFAAAVEGAGAVVSFSGLTRDLAAGGLEAMEIEHYPGMTEKALGAIRAEAIARFGLAEAMILHRHGRLAPGEPIMMVATAARHRADAFAAAEFLMDYLKSRAPFWKKEISGGGAEWVAARDEDEDALSRW